MKTFIEQATELLNNTPARVGNEARLAHWLSEAVNKLEAVVSQANAQFNAGDRHATFNKQTIEAINTKE